MDGDRRAHAGTSPASRSSAAAPATRARGPRSACEEAIHVTCERAFGTADLSGRSIAVVGLGRVGGALARAARRGRRASSWWPTSTRASARWPSELGADWTDPDAALTADVDVLAPCALGGVLNDDTVPALRCRAIAGAANNQLAADALADRAGRARHPVGAGLRLPTPAASSTSGRARARGLLARARRRPRARRRRHAAHDLRRAPRRAGATPLAAALWSSARAPPALEA